LTINGNKAAVGRSVSLDEERFKKKTMLIPQNKKRSGVSLYGKKFG